MRRLLLFVLVVVSLSGCVRNRQYHAVADSVSLPSVEAPYRLAFIEFDDMGEFWDRQQMNRTLEAIGQANDHGRRQAIVVTFIHGWKHNASDSSGNVWGFREQLKEIAEKYQPIPVVGVYIGWRGNVTNIPLIKQFTFYNRRNAAIRIPGANITEALYQIMRTTRQGENNTSMCVLVGHSFGGMVLERALTQPMVSLINNYEANKEKSKNELPALADLIVFVNSAAPATEAKQLLGMLKAREYHVTPVNGREPPFFLSITSEGDTATGLAMPIGQAPSKITKAMRQYEPLDKPDDNPKKHPEWPWGISSQSSYYLHSTANMPALQSHRIVKHKIPPSGEVECEAHTYDYVDLNGYRYCIVEKEQRWNNTPYWAMQMPVEFVPDHGNIFRKEFRDLLIKFLPTPTELKQRTEPRTLYKAATAQ